MKRILLAALLAALPAAAWSQAWPAKPIRFIVPWPPAGGADVLPVFSPDGTKLMWTASRSVDRSSQLWIADFKLPE